MHCWKMPLMIHPTGHTACQISCWYIYLWQAYGPKTVSVDDVIFRTAILSISRHCTEIKITFFWNPEIKLVQKHTFLNRKYKFENLTLCDPGLTQPFSVVDFHWVGLQNGFNFWIPRSKMTTNMCCMPEKEFLNLAIFCDLTLTLTSFSMTLMLTGFNIYASMLQ